MDDLISRKALIEFANNSKVGITANDIARFPSAQQWIPCSERLPDEGVNVLTQGVNGNMITNRIVDGKRGWWFWDDEFVAWMPLPEPYKGDSNG